MSSLPLRRILILAANPKNSSELRLGEEVREIDEGLKRARYHDQFEVVSKWAVRSRDFYRHILDIQPYIAHFSGHGAGEDGIVLEDDAGNVQLVSTNALESLFKLFAGRGLECVFLNACFSKTQAEAISKHIPYVIGMSNSIGDKAAIAFAVAFYDALGAGETIEFAYDLALTALQIIGISTPLIPTLIKKPMHKCESSLGIASEKSQIRLSPEKATPALLMARRSLEILREQAAGYGKLQVPSHLKIELEDKEKEVAELEKSSNSPE